LYAFLSQLPDKEFPVKKSVAVAASVAALSMAQSAHALVGLGFSYGHNTASVSAASGALSTVPGFFKSVADTLGYTTPSVTLDRAKVSGLQQLGAKAWLDLPLVPVEFEAGANVAWGSYKSNLVLRGVNPGDSLPVDVGLNTPVPVPGIKDGETPYVQTALDLSARYVFLKLPPLSPLKPFKMYVGGGMTWFYTSKVISEKDVKEIFANAPTSVSSNPVQAQAALAKQLSNNFYESKVGGHLLLGAQLKVPVIPIAFFADGKWYFNAATSDAATNNPFSVSVGAAFAL
jgi:hypothetical protein